VIIVSLEGTLISVSVEVGDSVPLATSCCMIVFSVPVEIAVEVGVAVRVCCGPRRLVTTGCGHCR
jgi:hypothetical protein